MSDHQRILLLMAHPKFHRSAANRPMFESAAAMDGVTAVDLYADYPSFDIDIAIEQKRLRDHDVVILQFPFFWYSTPSLLKEWQDLVLEYGFAYGAGGTALQGKSLLCALTAGGSAQAYGVRGSNKFSIDELLRPLQQTDSLCAMRWLSPFVLYEAITAAKGSEISAHLQAWQQLLTDLRAATNDSGVV